MTQRVSKERRPRYFPWIAAFCCVFALLAVRHFVIAPYSVPSNSMQPALHPGDIFLSHVPGAGVVQRGDIVVFDGTDYFPDPDGTTTFVKRVIAVGGDSVRCCTETGHIEVNDVAMEEPYVFPGDNPSDVEFDVAVPTGTIFVLGDHRSESADSRDHLGSPGGGMIPLSRITGNGVWVVWPLGRFGEVS